MKYKTLFRLALKVVGVYLMASFLLSTLGHVSWVVADWLQPPSWSDPGRVPRLLIQAGLQSIIAMFGLYLFFRGEWIVNLAIPSNRPYCPECGYEVSKVKSHICPECGTAFRAPAGVEGKAAERPGAEAEHG